MNFYRIGLIALLAASGFVPANADAPAPAPAPRSCRATTPTPRSAMVLSYWPGRFEAQKAALAKAGPGTLLFLGDSITHYWETTGSKVFADSYSRYSTVNFGIGGDFTEQVLWRLINGGLKENPPRLVVLLIGTNNLYRDSVADIVAGITAIVDQIKKDCPKTKILMLSILPRGNSPRSRFRGKIAAINTEILELAKKWNIETLDMTSTFLESDGSMLRTIMPDELHPSCEGYLRMTKVMDPVIARLMKD